LQGPSPGLGDERMKGSMRRALGLWIFDLVPEVQVYADEVGQKTYPLCTVTELTYSLRPLGCGKRDVQTRDSETNKVSRSGRLVRVESTFRVQFAAPSSNEMNGAEIVDCLQHELEEAVSLAAIDDLVLVDAEAAPQVSFSVDRIAISSRQTLPQDTSGEPFLHRAATTLIIARTIIVDKPVEGVMERIHLDAVGE
jgi:hypothetical protein